MISGKQEEKLNVTSEASDHDDSQWNDIEHADKVKEIELNQDLKTFVNSEDIEGKVNKFFLHLDKDQSIT